MESLEEEMMKGSDEGNGKGGHAKWKESQKDNEERHYCQPVSHTTLRLFVWTCQSWGKKLVRLKIDQK